MAWDPKIKQWVKYPKYFRSKRVPWLQAVEDTTSGHAVYKPHLNVEKVDEQFLNGGVLIHSDAGMCRYFVVFKNPIGASGGAETRIIVVNW